MFPNPVNHVIGDFKYVQDGANPPWHYFFDDYQNVVQYGGNADSTDVIVRIRGGSVEVLHSRLREYMTELVLRHNEVLHEEGEKRFHAVTISLPYKDRPTSEGVTIHTGSGCCYDQDEIAYEVMAALSGVPVYKAISPEKSCYGFTRVDSPKDQNPITFFSEKIDVMVAFSYQNDDSAVMCHIPKTPELEKYMFDLFAEFVIGRTQVPFIRSYGLIDYIAENPADSLSVCIQEEHGGSRCSFSMKVPYNLSFESFPRLCFAQHVMQSLHEKFHKEEVG
jgi:hypothetical protein